jgi:hypothetical protein
VNGSMYPDCGLGAGFAAGAGVGIDGGVGRLKTTGAVVGFVIRGPADLSHGHLVVSVRLRGDDFLAFSTTAAFSFPLGVAFAETLHFVTSLFSLPHVVGLVALGSLRL